MTAARGVLQVMLMQSKSMPKRVHFTGSDGERYRFLAKPDDDLRRDMRVMEFASLLNRLLEADANTRRRDMQASPSPPSLVHTVCAGTGGSNLPFVFFAMYISEVVATSVCTSARQCQHVQRRLGVVLQCMESGGSGGG